MSFGLCNSLATFQRFMNMIFKVLIKSGHVVVYMDVILIFTKDLVTLDYYTHLVLKTLMAYNLYLKPKKCTFQQTCIEYLGLLISKGWISMDPVKVGGITQWPTPARLHDIQAFLGFCNFYCCFICDYSMIACLLFDLAKKDMPFQWGAPQEASFRALISAFTLAPVLMLPNHD